MIAYWFSKEDGTSEYNTNPAEAGRTDTVEGDLVPCHNGLHASPTPFDAMQYASGPIMWEVEISDELVPHGDPIDKYAARSRKYLRRVDLTRVMRKFAAQQALSVGHLWEAPLIASEYLTAEAEGINRSDIRGAARDAVWCAAWDPARCAASGAAQDAAWSAALDAAEGAVWTAAWDAAGSAVWATARAAAGDATGATERATVRTAARNAAWDAASAKFNQMALEALGAK